MSNKKTSIKNADQYIQHTWNKQLQEWQKHYKNNLWKYTFVVNTDLSYLNMLHKLKDKWIIEIYNFKK